MVKYCDEHDAQNDQYITKWARLAGIKIYYPIPGLVDHREGVSLYRRNTNRPNPNEARKAISFDK